MQKKLIALAIAGLATAPAFAQSNVTIYGVADTTWEYVGAKDATLSKLTGTRVFDQEKQGRVSANSSLLGFKGAEDLGNGLKAIFQFEGGVSSDTGLSTFSARDTFVGLTSNFGTVVLGNLTHPIRAIGTKVDMNPGATGIGFVGSMYGEFLGVKTGTDDRAKNAVAYVSPSFSGLTVTGAYVAGENKSNSDQTGTSALPLVTLSDGVTTLGPIAAQTGKNVNGYQWQLAAQYENGPVWAGIGYHDAKDPQVLSSVVNSLIGGSGITSASDRTLLTTYTNAALGAYNDELKVWRIGATYTFPSATKISALWDNQKYEVEGSGGSTDGKRNAWMLGVSQDIGPHTIYGEYAEARKVTGDICNGSSFCDQTKAKQWTLGYNYNFSKRTMLKAYYSEIRNNDNAAYDYYINPTLRSGALSAGADPKGFGVGLRHVF